MRHDKTPHPYRMKHEETAAFMPVDLGTLAKGDICVRAGTPHIVVYPPADVTHDPTRVWVVDLLSGGWWHISANEQVYPAINVKLTFASGRRSE